MDALSAAVEMSPLELTYLVRPGLMALTGGAVYEQHLSCPLCGHPVEVRAEAGVHQVECPACLHPIRVVVAAPSG